MGFFDLGIRLMSWKVTNSVMTRDLDSVFPGDASKPPNKIQNKTKKRT